MADIFTTAGEEYVADVFDATVAPATNYYVGWGTGAGTAAKGDTTLFTEAAESRVIMTMSQPAADTNRGVATITSASGQTITNGGMLTLSSGGTLVVHGDHTGTALLTGDKIEYTIDLQWA